MALKSSINEDMKTAMRAKDAARLSTIRLLLAAVKQREVDERITLDDAGVIAVIEKMIKQRRESIAQFEKAARQDLADEEKLEIGFCRPTCRSSCREAEIDAVDRERDRRVRRDGGRRTWARSWRSLKPQLAGRADMGKVSALVKAKLAG